MKHSYTRDTIISEIQHELHQRNITQFSDNDVDKRLQKHEGFMSVSLSDIQDDIDETIIASAAAKMQIKIMMLGILQEREQKNIQRNIEWLLRETIARLQRKDKKGANPMIHERFATHISVAKDRHVSYIPSQEEITEKEEREEINTHLRFSHKKREYNTSPIHRDRLYKTMESLITTTKNVIVSSMMKRQETIITPLLATHNNITLTIKKSIPTESLTALKEKGGNALTIVMDASGKAKEVLLDIKTYQVILQKTPQLIDDICESDPERHLTLE
jgi:hypothetical protein